MGVLLLNGWGGALDDVRARSFFLTGCNGGRAQACVNYAFMLREGLGGAKNAAQADVYDRRACQLGLSASCPAGKTGL